MIENFGRFEMTRRGMLATTGAAGLTFALPSISGGQSVDIDKGAMTMTTFTTTTAPKSSTRIGARGSRSSFPMAGR